MTKNKIINLTADILEHLFFASNDILSASMSKKVAFRLFNKKYYHQYTETSFIRWLNNFRDQGYVVYEHHSDSFVFTSKTKLKLAEQIGGSLKNSETYQFFSFDIPETIRGKRNAFRHAIKKLGCKQIQKSLWVSNKNVYDIVQEFAFEFSVERYLISIISSKTDADGIIKNLFSK